MAEAVIPVAGSADWRVEIPESRRKRIRGWLWSVALMTFGVLVVGGITRLTLSGLSIVEWRPFTGVIPPLTDAQWQATFEQYQRYPEYQAWRQGMTLGEFKGIFFWEYLHRLLARTIGLVFLLPFLFFWVRGWFNRPLLKRSVLLFGLGASQGLMGWLMVASGLVDMPRVSHLRLAAHLSLAFLIFGYSVWLTRELSVGAERTKLRRDVARLMRRGLGAIGVLLAAQVVWGAFVAGLRAGKFYNTFPLMGGRLVPADLLALDVGMVNFVQNPAAVQWSHRVLGTVLLLAMLGFGARVLRAGADARTRRLCVTMMSLLLLQYALGIATLLLRVPVSLGVIHQATALVIFGVWVAWWHHVRESAR